MNHPESHIQCACVQWFRLQYPEYARLLFAVPNGGVRNAVTGRILKAEGVVAGVADLLLFVPSNGYHGLCLELKTEKGRQSEAQKEWQHTVQQQGYKYIVVRSLQDFREQVNGYIYRKL